MARVTVVESTRLADTAAGRIAHLIEASIAARAAATVCLTGGSTPRQTYVALADPARSYRRQIDWARVHLFWGDERHVPPDHPDSNFGMANRALVQHAPIPPDHVHRIRGELVDAHDAAAEYARGLPESFDVMLLGLGADCHIASIFPGSELLEPESSVGDPRQTGPRAPDMGRAMHNRDVAAVFAPHLNAWRITLTPPVILSSRAIVLLVSGEEKAAAVAAAIEAPLDVRRFPGQLLRDAGDRVEWIIDRAAAARLRDA
jgi:6-phosphogluconolactonase